MKTHKILFEKTGENSTTAPDPVKVYVEGMVDLTTQKTCCVSSDFDMLVSVTRYEVREVGLPDWLTPERWLNDVTAWKYVWGMGASMEWPESWQRGIKAIHGSAYRLAAIKLLKTKKFRSEFRKSLHAQLIAWMETPGDDRKFQTPFSARQWEALADRYTCLEAKRTESNLYYGGRYG